MIGPMSEDGFVVGGNVIYYFLNQTDAQSFNNIIFTTGITIENINSNINPILSNVQSWNMITSNDLNSPTGPYATGHTFVSNLNLNYYLYPASLISNICFLKDTPILTDQGTINIQNISNHHTINGLKVNQITQTTSIDKELVCFEKDSISIGCPNKKTIMTRNHKVFHGTMVNADTLLKDTIYLIPYNGEILYNVLLEKNGYMNVNGLICETLDINNIIALFYKSKYTVEEKNKIMSELNKNINNRYKEISYQYFSKYVNHNELYSM
jgi:hypothetical protein